MTIADSYSVRYAPAGNPNYADAPSFVTQHKWAILTVFGDWLFVPKDDVRSYLLGRDCTPQEIKEIFAAAKAHPYTFRRELALV